MIRYKYNLNSIANETIQRAFKCHFIAHLQVACHPVDAPCHEIRPSSPVAGRLHPEGTVQPARGLCFARIPGQAEGGPDDAGIEPEDIITEINGEKLTEENPLAEVIKDARPGDTLKLEIWRDGDLRTMELVVGAFEE